MTPSTKSVEKTIRAAVVTFIGSALDIAGHVFGRRRYITSKADFVRKLGQKQADDRTEVYFVEVEFLRYENDPERGSDDCPAIIFVYGIRLFRQFNDGRADDSNSDQDFTEAILDLRDAFITAANEDPDDNPFAPGVMETSNDLTMPENAQFGTDDLVDVVGHAADLELRIGYFLGND